MPALLALSPILLILVLMVVLRWSAAAAGLAGLAATVAIALFGFDYGRETPQEIGPAAAIGGALAEAAFVGATILWIIVPALCIYELQLAGGAFDVLRAALARLSDDPRVLAILVAWFFGLFMEGAAGFGTPVALAGPILVSLGFGPVQAVTLVLIGHAAGVSFGAVGTPVLPQVAMTGLPAVEIARATGLLHALAGWLLLIFVVRIAGRSQPEAAAGQGGVLAWALGAAACFLVPYLALSWFVGPELPTLAGALVGGLVFVWLLRRRRGVASSPAIPASGRELVRAALPYLVLLVLILGTRLVAPVQDALRAVEWTWTLRGGFTGSVQPLYHPGTMLMLGFLVGGALQGRRAADMGDAIARAARRLPLVVVALAAMLGLARLMVHSGMVAELAAAAAGVGPAWPWIAPVVGVLGTFITGSATASNILLTDFQQATAQGLGLPVLWLVAAQGFGAAVGNIVCPHNIIAGGATVGLQGQEGAVLRRTSLACLVYAVAGGTLVALTIALA